MLHTTLRQLGLVSGRALLLLALTAGAMTAWTSTAKAEVITVENLEIKTVSFTPAPIQVNPANASAYTDATSIGALAVQYNHIAGYDIKVASANEGVLKNTVTPTYTAAYKLSVTTANTNVTPATAFTPSSTPTSIASVAFDPSLINLDVKITNDGADFKVLPKGNYTDTVTFTLVNK